ncbi:MAG: hypothetical protein HYV07_09285 [Deltaproteobacteria bacterium]|nr:hypothetical protein [Deltaproteobacteria bacterium]
MRRGWILGMVLACGGEESLGLSISLGALVAGAQSAEVYLFEGRSTCEQVAAFNPRGANALYGPYSLSLDATNRSGAHVARNDLKSGSYLVWVDARDGAGKLVGTGCTPGQRIEDQRVSRIDVFLQPVVP